jgi:hypothetical protein
MSEDKAIFGKTTMTFPDQARIVARPLAKYLLIFSIAMAVTMFIVWSSFVSDRDWLLLRHAPLSMWRTVFLRAFPAEDREQILRWAQQGWAERPQAPSQKR